MKRRRPTTAGLLAVLLATAASVGGAGAPPAAAQATPPPWPAPPPSLNQLPPDIAVLGMAQDTAALELHAPDGGAVRLDGRPVVAQGELPMVAVHDLRPVPGPWSLTATITDFVVDGSGATCGGHGDFRCIPGGNVGWTPAAVVPTYDPDPPPVTTGPTIEAGTRGSNLRTGPQLLCASPPPTGDGTAPYPTVVCSAGVVVLVPASTAAGTYTATLTLTLV